MDDIVLLYSAGTSPEAVIIISILEGEGIKYIAEKTKPEVYTTGFEADPTHPIRIYVRKSDFRRAKALIRNLSS